jgi:two-component sensor histidine kinase
MVSVMTTGTAIQRNPHVEVGFSPTIALISVVRAFVSDFYARVLSSDVREMVSMATHELLENAVKYGIEDRATFRIEVEHRDT